MSDSRLRAHYLEKYAHEAEESENRAIDTRGVPTSRFEAAAKFVPRYFRGGDILELGAGAGEIASRLLRDMPEIDRYVLGDLSVPRVEGLRRRLRDPRVQAIEMDVEDIPHDFSQRYDAVLMVALIEHLIDPLRAMQRVRHLLRPGGFVYLDTPNIAKYTRRLKLLFGVFPATASRNEGLVTYAGDPVDLYDEGHLHYFTFRSLSSMLTQRCGFSRVVKLAYPVGTQPLGKRIHYALARLRPELFSELALIAFA